MSAEALKSKTNKTIQFRVQTGASVQEVGLNHVVDEANPDYAASLYALAQSKFSNPENVTELLLAISGRKEFPGTVLGELEEVAPDSVIDSVAEATMADEAAFAKIAGLDVEDRQQLVVDYLTHEQQQRANKKTAGQVTTRQLVRLPSTREPEPALALVA